MVATNARVLSPRSRVNRRSPRCCWPCRPEWKRFGRRWAMGVAPSSVYHTAPQYRRSRVGETRHRPAHAYHALDSQCAHLHPRTLLQAKGGEGRMSPTLPRTSTIYNDDVSSGPRLRAHWYMLTHHAAATRLPTGPRIALHRVPVPYLHHYCA